MNSVLQEAINLAKATQRAVDEFKHIVLEGELTGQQQVLTQLDVLSYTVPDNSNLIIVNVEYFVVPFEQNTVPATTLSPAWPALARDDWKFWWQQGQEIRTDNTKFNQLSVLGGACLHVFNQLQPVRLRAEAQGNITSPELFAPNKYRLLVRADGFLTQPSIAQRLTEISTVIPSVGETIVS